MTTHSGDILIRMADIGDIDAIASAIVLTLTDDQILNWLIADPVERIRIATKFFRLHVKLGIDKGFVNIAETEKDGLLGANIWLPNDASDETFDAELNQVVIEHSSKFEILGETMRKFYPPITPYYQLMMAVVLPAAHKKGIGSKLLSYQLQKMDLMGIPTYLEASTRLSAGGVYQRFGYQPIGEPVSFPTGIELYPMWRHAHHTYTLEHTHGNDDYGVSGNIVQFGGLNWQILDVSSSKMLIISDKVIEAQKFHNCCEGVPWIHSDIRKYLNDTFYNRFTEEDKIRIIETIVPSSNNPWFGTDGGKTTYDKIFLLNINEAVKYFGDSGQLQNKNPNTKYYISDNFNIVRKAIDVHDLPSCWWLRTPGNNPIFASMVTIDGRINVSGDFVNRTGAYNLGIRPALWIKKLCS